jgi:hypothetical protein
MALVLVAIRLDILGRRDTPTLSPAPTMPSAVLHDVASALHGRDRRTAEFVCKAWRRAACDPMLPVTTADIQAWVVPAVTEMARAYPDFVVKPSAVEVVWALTGCWLQGCL